MNPETDKYCHVCSLSYESGECPSCNPKNLYHVEYGIPCGPDDFEWRGCECGCGDTCFKREAISHAKSLIRMEEQLVRVCDDQGTEVWANR